MAETAEPLPQPENSHASGARPGETGAGQPFTKGRSGNPGGRPRGLARKVREILGDDDGEAIAGFWAACMSGYLTVIDPDTGERTYEKITVADRISVSKLLAERGWGKPPQFAPIEDDDPLDLAERETDEIAAGLDARLDELHARREAKLAASGE